jgi:AcrR family transcriptional regulator
MAYEIDSRASQAASVSRKHAVLEGSRPASHLGGPMEASGGAGVLGTEAPQAKGSHSRERTRNAILDATDRIMIKQGFRKMSMQDLAREAGISKKTIYLYFCSKEDVALSSIGRVVECVHTRLAEIVNGVLPPEVKLREFLVERVMGRVRKVKDYYWSLDELFELVRPAYMARRQLFFARELELIVRILRQGKKADSFNLDDEWGVANALLFATNAFLPYSLSVDELSAPDEIEERIVAMADLLIRGLTAQDQDDADREAV